MRRDVGTLIIGVGIEVIFVILGVTLEEMPTALAIAGYVVGGLCIVGGLVWLLSPKLGIALVPKNLEIRVIASRYLDKPPYYSLTPGHSLTAIFGLVLVNHSTETKEHIASASLSLKQRRWLIGSKTLFSLPLEIQGYPNDHPFEDVEIEPQSKREFTFNFHKGIPAIKPFPRRSKLMLVLEMIGPNRKIEYELEEIRHNPKQVPDVPDWKRN